MISKEELKELKECFPVGCRVKLLRMFDPFRTLPPGLEGVVRFVDDMGTIHVEWDNGSTLGVVSGIDYAYRIDD